MDDSKNAIGMPADTPGKQFYLRQVENLLAGDADRLVELNYEDDALLTSPDFIVRGKDALKAHFHRYLEHVRIERVLSTDKFAETESTVLFEATIQSSAGVAAVYDAFVLSPAGKIKYHFTGVK